MVAVVGGDRYATSRKVAETFGLEPSTVVKWWQRYRALIAVTAAGYGALLLALWLRGVLPSHWANASAAYFAAVTGHEVGMLDLMRATQREYRKLGRLCVPSEFGPWFELVVG